MRRWFIGALLVAPVFAHGQVQHAEALVHQEQQGTLLRLREQAPAPPSCSQVIGQGEVGPVIGKFSILFFWGPWCAPCKPGLAALGDIARAGASDLNVASAAFIDPGAEEVAQARAEVQTDIEKYRPAAPVCIYGDAKQQSAWGAEGVPVLVMFDKQGKAVRFLMGGPRTLEFLRLVEAGWRPR